MTFTVSLGGKAAEVNSVSAHGLGCLLFLRLGVYGASRKMKSYERPRPQEDFKSDEVFARVCAFIYLLFLFSLQRDD